MAPIQSGLSAYEEAAIISCLPPTLRVDIMTSSPAVKDGENFMSVVTRVYVFGHDLDTGAKVTLSLIMKRPPESAERRQLFFCDAAFHNEAAFFSEVAPGLGKLPFPPCLLASDDVIVLRDMRQDGFTMADRRAGLDLDHCLLVMKELGRFHATSYEMKKNNPQEFSRIASAVNEIFIRKDNLILPACVDNCISMALKTADNPDLPVIATLKSILGRGFSALSPHVVPEEPMAVLCHGDLWSNNLLFRYLEGFTCPTEVCFLDLQGSRYASPALDILYFLFTSGAPACHFRRLISAYHQLVQEYVSLEDLMDEVRKHSLFGLVMSLMVLPVVTADDVIVNLDDVTEENLLDFQDKMEEGMFNAGYRKRVNELFSLITKENLL